jgi:hypothetical protein
VVRRIIDLQRQYQVANRAAIARSANKELSPTQQKARDPYDVVDDLDNEVENYQRLLARKIR